MADQGRTLTDGKAPVEYRVNMLKCMFFIGLGVVLDIFDFGLGITGVGEIADEIVDGVADLVIPTTAWMLGIPLGGAKANEKLMVMLTMEIAKLVPFLNILPEYTYETSKLILLSRAEDRERSAEKAKRMAVHSAREMQRAVRAAEIRHMQQNRREQAQLDAAANDNAAAEEEALAA